MKVGQTPNALFSLPTTWPQERHSFGKSVAREPEGRLREPARTGGSVGGRVQESDPLRFLRTPGLTPKLWIHGSDPNIIHRL